MTRLDFMALCGQYMLSPNVVLENQSVRDALADRDDKRVAELLETEF